MPTGRIWLVNCINTCHQNTLNIVNELLLKSTNTQQEAYYKTSSRRMTVLLLQEMSLILSVCRHFVNSSHCNGNPSTLQVADDEGAAAQQVGDNRGI